MPKKNSKKWTFTVWMDWTDGRRSTGNKVHILTQLEGINNKQLNYWLAYFIVEVSQPVILKSKCLWLVLKHDG